MAKDDPNERTTARRLKRLLVPGMRLEGDDPKVNDTLNQQAALRAGKDFNPYNSRPVVGRGGAAPPPRPAKPRITQPVRPAKKPGFFARLLGRK